MAFLDQAEDLAVLVADANDRLGLSRDVPMDVESVIDKVVQALPTPAALALDGVDPYLTGALTHGLIRCLTGLRIEDPATRALELRIGLEEVRQALAYIADEGFPASALEPSEIVVWLLDTLATTQTDLARVLDVHTRTLSRWQAEESVPTGEDAARLEIVARIVSNLQHAMTGPGVVMWFEQTHPDLGRPPIALLKDAGLYPKLLHLAARARSHVAS